MPFSSVEEQKKKREEKRELGAKEQSLALYTCQLACLSAVCEPFLFASQGVVSQCQGQGKVTVAKITFFSGEW